MFVFQLWQWCFMLVISDIDDYSWLYHCFCECLPLSAWVCASVCRSVYHYCRRECVHSVYHCWRECVPEYLPLSAWVCATVCVSVYVSVGMSATDESELLTCLHSLMKEQYVCQSKLASSTLSVTQLTRQIAVIERHFIAIARHKHSPRTDTANYLHRKKMNLEANLSKQKRYYYDIRWHDNNDSNFIEHICG